MDHDALELEQLFEQIIPAKKTKKNVSQKIKMNELLDENCAS